MASPSGQTTAALGDFAARHVPGDDSGDGTEQRGDADAQQPGH